MHAVEASRLKSFHETKTTIDVLMVIGEGARNHHSKEVIAFNYDTK
jgi:hypothetical protein